MAKAAGVATSTVSRALSGDGRVADATRRHVIEVADGLGYRPSRSARALRGAQTRTLGFLGPDFTNIMSLTHLQAAVRIAFERGYTLFVCDTQGQSDILAAQVERLVEHRVDGILFGRGIIMMTAEVERMLARSGIPLEPDVELSAEADYEGTRPFNPYLERAEIERGASMVAYRHLFALGHRKIAYFARPISMRTVMGDTRRATLREAVAQAELPEEALVEVLAVNPEDCIAEVQNLAGLADPPTAIVCGNGLLTTGILRGIYRAGWRIPDDVSLLTFGDSPWHMAQHPPVAVIHHDYAAAARRALDRLIARAEHAEEIPNPPRRPAEFLPRGSLGPPRAR